MNGKLPPLRTKLVEVAMTEPEYLWLKGRAKRQGTTPAQLLRALVTVTFIADQRQGFVTVAPGKRGKGWSVKFHDPPQVWKPVGMGEPVEPLPMYDPPSIDENDPSPVGDTREGRE